MRPGKTITHATRGCRPRALRGPLTVALMCLVVACGAGSGAIIEVADFRDDFQSPTPAAGWSYLWNENGAIGDAANYDDLGWNGNRYDSDGDSQFPDPSPARYVMINANGGHPGCPEAGGQLHDRFAIAGYSVEETAEYSISDSLFENSADGGDGVELKIYVNNTEARGEILPDQGSTTFDMVLGELTAGDTIYVAMGPRDGDSYDTTQLDFTINQVPEPTAAGLVILAALAFLGRPRQRT